MGDQKYRIVTFDLDVARDKVRIGFSGDFIEVIEHEGTDATIRLDKLDADPIDLTKIVRIKAPFKDFYLTHSAQSGKNLILAIGGEANFEVARQTPFENPRGNTTGTTTAAYVTALTKTFQNYSKMLLHIIETGGAQSMKYKIHGSVCGTTWHEIVAATDLAASADEYETITDAWSFIRVQVIDDSGHATYNICWSMKA